MRGMDATATTAPAESIIHWATIHPVLNQAHVEAVADSMDSNPDHWVWDGPPLVADIDAGQLYSGVHRQAALRLLHERDGIDGWDIPVVDIWDLIDHATFDAPH